MNKPFTANEVRKFAHNATTTRAMLHAYADRLEADEKVVPAAEILTSGPDEGYPCIRWATGFKFPEGAKLYTHPSPADADWKNNVLAGDMTVSALTADAERLAKALQEILNYRGGAANALEDEYVVDRAHQALAAHSTQAQPPAASDDAEQLALCRKDWQSVCDAVKPGWHFNPEEIIARLKQPPAARVSDAMVERAQDCLHDKGKDIGYYHMRAALEAALAAQETKA